MAWPGSQMNNWHTYSWIFPFIWHVCWRKPLHKTERIYEVQESLFLEDFPTRGSAKLRWQEGEQMVLSQDRSPDELLWTKTMVQKKSAQLHLLIRKEVEQSTVRVVGHRNRLPRECLVSWNCPRPSWMELGAAFCSGKCPFPLQRAKSWVIFTVPCNQSYS